MTPKEKAEELAGKYWDLNYGWDGVTKDDWATEGALIAVEELINAHNAMKDFLFSEIGYLITSPDYWQEVKQEIEKL